MNRNKQRKSTKRQHVRLTQPTAKSTRWPSKPEIELSELNINPTKRSKLAQNIKQQVSRIKQTGLKQQSTKPLALSLLALLVLFGISRYKPTITPLFRYQKSQPTTIKLWPEQSRVKTLQIPSLNYTETAVTQIKYDTDEKTWPTPINGIATPQEYITNNIILYGHSKWLGTTTNFAVISKLKPGDEILLTDQFGNTRIFVVKKLELVDRLNGEAVHAKPSLQVTMLTSARYNGEWLLPNEIDASTVDTTKDKDSYAIFVVTALPK